MIIFSIFANAFMLTGVVSGTLFAVEKNWPATAVSLLIFGLGYMINILVHQYTSKERRDD